MMTSKTRKMYILLVVQSAIIIATFFDLGISLVMMMMSLLQIMNIPNLLLTIPYFPLIS